MKGRRLPGERESSLPAGEAGGRSQLHGRHRGPPKRSCACLGTPLGMPVASTAPGGGIGGRSFEAAQEDTFHRDYFRALVLMEERANHVFRKAPFSSQVHDLVASVGLQQAKRAVRVLGGFGFVWENQMTFARFWSRLNAMSWGNDCRASCSWGTMVGCSLPRHVGSLTKFRSGSWRSGQNQTFYAWRTFR